MKRLLEPREVLQAGDEWFNVDSHSWELTKEVGRPAHPSAIYRRKVHAPQWQTGPIPEPTGLAVLVLEAIYSPFVIYCTDATGSYWCKSGHSARPEHELDWFANEYTGRWYIQPITIPQP